MTMTPNPPVIGQQLVIACQSGHTNYRIQKDCKTIVNAEKHTIGAFAVSDAGSWKCRATVGGTDRTSTSIVVPSAGKYRQNFYRYSSTKCW